MTRVEMMDGWRYMPVAKSMTLPNSWRYVEAGAEDEEDEPDAEDEEDESDAEDEEDEPAADEDRDEPDAADEDEDDVPDPAIIDAIVCPFFLLMAGCGCGWGDGGVDDGLMMVG